MIDESFKRWLKIFGLWLKQTQVKAVKPLITYDRWLEEQPGRILDTRLSMLSDDDIRFKRPGAIATWNLINHSEPNGGVIITLDNLHRLTAQLDSHRKDSEFIRRGLERSLGLTHRFQVSWVFRSGDKFRFVIIDSIDIDLSSQFIDESARDIIRYLAIEAFSMRRIPSMSWRERIYFFPWLDSILQLSPKKGCPDNPRHRRLCRRIQRVSF